MIWKQRCLFKIICLDFMSHLGIVKDIKTEIIYCNFEEKKNNVMYFIFEVTKQVV